MKSVSRQESIRYFTIFYINVDLIYFLCFSLNYFVYSTFVPESNCDLPLGQDSNSHYWTHTSDGNSYDSSTQESYVTNYWMTYHPILDLSNMTSQYQHELDCAWIMIDFHHPTIISGLLLKGDVNADSWVTHFVVSYSTDCEQFSFVTSVNASIKIYDGNFDLNTTVRTTFTDVLIVRCIKIFPVSIHGKVTALGFQILGCELDLCKEAVIHHLEYELFNQSFHPKQISSYFPQHKVIRPTILTTSLAEFKFHTEHILFGCIFYDAKDDSLDQKVIITYSRNCHTWQPIREKKGFGDPQEFSFNFQRFTNSIWQPFPYPVRAQCIRMIKVTNPEINVNPDVYAQFIGCGTGAGILHQCGLRKGRSRFKRVIGGSPSDPDWYPWLVSIRLYRPDTSTYVHLCAATLIHPQWILTAAHCINLIYTINTGLENINSTRHWTNVTFLDDVIVTFAEYNVKVKDVAQFDINVTAAHIHNNYTAGWVNNDVALLKLSRPVRLTDHVNVICLSDQPQDFDLCQLAGWGVTDTDSGRMATRPNYISLPIIDQTECRAAYHNVTDITPDMICAGTMQGGKDECSGDSGSPLMCPSYTTEAPGVDRRRQWLQVGIGSWSTGCGRKGRPGVYARVSYFVTWINDIIDNYT